MSTKPESNTADAMRELLANKPRGVTGLLQWHRDVVSRAPALLAEIEALRVDRELPMVKMQRLVDYGISAQGLLDWLHAHIARERQATPQEEILSES